MERRSRHMEVGRGVGTVVGKGVGTGVGKGVVVVVGGRCGGRPCGCGGFSVVGPVVGMEVGRVVGEQEPIGGRACVEH